MALRAYSARYFAARYFRAVWFAPADETGVPDEELRPEYGGGGRRLGAKPYRDPFADDDLVQRVRDKWEAIERAQAEDSAHRPVGADGSISTQPKTVDSGAIRAAAVAIASPDLRYPAPIDAPLSGVAQAALDAVAAAERIKRRNDEALLLILATA